MSAPFRLTPQAMEDLSAIWWFIAEDSRDAAGRVETEVIATCRRLAKHRNQTTGPHGPAGAFLDAAEVP